MSQSDNPSIDGRPISDLKVVELRHELEIRNLPKSGKKNELVERLRNHLISTEEDEGEQQAGQGNTYKEYRSLTEVRPVSKSPTKSPLKSPTSSAGSGTSSPSKLATPAENYKSLVEEQQPGTEDTFHTAHDQTTDLDLSTETTQNESNIEAHNTSKVEAQNEISPSDTNEIIKSADEKPSPENMATADADKPEIEETSEPVPQAMEELPEQKDESATECQDEDVTPEQTSERNEVMQEDTQGNVVDVEDDEEMIDEDKQGKGDDELDYEEEETPHDAKSVDDESKTEEEQKTQSEVEPNDILPTIDVKADASSNDVAEDRSDDNMEKEEVQEEKTSKQPERVEVEQTAKPTPMVTPEGFVRRREVSPARNKASEFLHIRNLKRPFTVKALKELLNTFGTISDDEFWIDSIKTNCIVKYANVEEAELARSRLHHVVWPSSSDASLVVEFSTEDKLSRRKGDDLNTNPAAGEPANITIVVDNKRDSTHKPRESGDIYVNSQKRKLDAGGAVTAKKSLDDLFKKTVAKPPVYYLPLSDAEAERRWNERSRSGGASRSNGHNDSDSRRRNGYNGRHSSPSRKRERRDSPVRRRY